MRRIWFCHMWDLMFIIEAAYHEDVVNWLLVNVCPGYGRIDCGERVWSIGTANSKDEGLKVLCVGKSGDVWMKEQEEKYLIENNKGVGI